MNNSYERRLKREMRSLLNQKRGQFQLPSQIVWGVVGFMLAVIIGLLFVSTLNNGGLFTAGSEEQGAVGNISANLTSGVNTVSAKFPTIFTVVAIAVILAILGVLVVIVKKYGMGGGSFSQ